jgi:hypothetical protein
MTVLVAWGRRCRFFFLHLASSCGLCWPMEQATARTAVETISADLRTILRALLAVIGAWKLEPARAMGFYNRVNAIAGRIERMLIRFRAGKLRRRIAPVTKAGARGKVAGRGPALPKRFGWLVRIGGWQAAGFGAQLQTVLATPDMRELLAAAPQAGRLLRPLCRALAVEWPKGFAAPGPAPEQIRERPIRKRRPRPKPEPYRIPLPRGVLSWARREGYKGI